MSRQRPSSAAAIRPGQAREGDFFSYNEKDTFSVRFEEGKAYDIALTKADNASLDILDASGRLLFESSQLDEPAASSSFPDGTQALVEDFRAPYTGTFFVRAETFASGPGDYTLAVAADPAAGPFDPAAPPSAGDDLLLGKAAAGDRINALAGDDLVLGRGGNDDLQGGDGSDAVLGGDGRDFVYGGPGSDHLFGDAGDDKLGGGFGRDFLTGGAGRDVFDMQGLGSDRVEDFAKGQDRIDLGKIDAKPAVAGDQAFAFIGTRDSTAAGQLNYEQVGEGRDVRTFVYGHTNGDGVPDFSVSLTGRITLEASDFAL